MSIVIVGVQNSNDPDKEFITLQVTDNNAGNLEHYLIHDDTFDGKGNPVNKERHTYFFPNTIELKAGDRILLYTGSGSNGSNPRRIGIEKLTFRFYWGLKACVWNDGGDTVHLLKHEIIDTQSI